MNNTELLGVLDNIEREKGISKEFLFKAIESAMSSAAKKILGGREAEVTAVIDRETGELKIISDGKEIRSAELGRISAQTAKQVIMQKIREAERDIIFDDYQKRVGSITNGTVHRFEKGDIIIDLGKTEAVLPKSQQSPKDRYKQGDRVRAYVLEVNRTSHGPQIVLSRSDAAFVKKLFEIEVPEIAEGIVEVKAVAREAGERTKFAVWSKDDKVDAVGACVGMRGQRVKDIVRELQGERVDIIRWSDDLREYVKAAVSPAETADIKIDKEHKKIEVIVADDQLSIGIGKHGQNIRLASKLIGWEMDIRGKEDKVKAIFGDKPAKEGPVAEEGPAGKEGADATRAKLTDIDGVGPKVEKALIASGYDSVEKIKSLTAEDLIKVEGIGKKTAEKIIKSTKEL
ncbi:MAG: transcription termination factor NusA [Candidatus Omnitrophota bacterium]